MERFLERHKDRIIGVLSGFDRVLFRGSLRAIYPSLVGHAIRHFGSDRVLRFLGRRTNHPPPEAAPGPRSDPKGLGYSILPCYTQRTSCNDHCLDYS